MLQLADEVLRQWAGGAAAFGFGLLLTPLVIRFAHRKNWLAHPKTDRWHNRPTALMGGISIYLAASLAIVLFASDAFPWQIWLGATVMFLTGLVDDLKNIKPAAKLVPQVIATGLLLYSGYVLGPEWAPWLSIPLTFLWVIGITNAINLLDNMDGLAAGIAAIAALVLAVCSIMAGSLETAVVAVSVAGSAAGFLFFNFNPARIFMGDCGSLFLGYTVAALALAIQSQPDSSGTFAVYVVPAAVLAVPIFDTTLVTILRTLSGRSVAQGGRDHSSHRLVLLGLSERQAVVTLYTISALFGALALTAYLTEITFLLALAAMMGVGLAVFGVHLGRAQVYSAKVQVQPLPEGAMQRAVLILQALFGGRQWKHVGAFLADLLLVISAFVLAHHLRFEEGLSAIHEEQLMYALPILAAVKLAVFYWGGLYGSIWRYAGTPEIVRIGWVTILASVLSYLALGVLQGFTPLSEGVALIDWMITAISIAGVRLGFRGLRQYISSKREKGRRILLYGAGDAGVVSLREIRQNPHFGLIPVAFLDDDVTKHGLRVQGLPVVGGFADMERICKQYSIEEVLITALSMAPKDRLCICAECNRISVSCRSFYIAFSPVEEITGSSDGANVEVGRVSNL
jgi:UDP-GlcNAc:undecaprenyl-phosphate/decaprenyl-phosphate GlcNAc-1-phosphate transferase